MGIQALGVRCQVSGVRCRIKAARVSRHLIIRSVSVIIAAILFALFSVTHLYAVTPESPEVQKLVNSALGFLEKNTDERLGGKCLVALAFVKSDRPDHPRVREALAECRKVMAANPPDAMLDVYSNGLAVILMCELAPQKHTREIQWFLNRMKARQKDHGGWGYHDYPTGDTSQTQYAALSYWEAQRHGFDIQGASVEQLADWLIRTQGPDGCWGYQGQLSTSELPVEQADTGCSMLAAGLGSLYICANLFGASQSSTIEEEAEDRLPPALRPVVGADVKRRPLQFRPQKISNAQIMETVNQAHDWMEKNYAIDIGLRRYYYLYALERYKSFQEALEGAVEEEPKWYNDGYQFLAKDQKSDGSWSGYCGAACDTAFSALFLLRSTQKSIRIDLGEGTLLSGRGLPSNLARAKMRNGELIIEQVHTKVDQVLSMVDEEDEGALDELARDPKQLIVDKVDEKTARRFQQLVRGGEPEVRLLAVRALGRTGNLDYAPSLLYALTDPDRRVVLEARNGLRFISRNFDGFGPPDNFTEQQRYEAADAWKNWYKSLRPDALLE
jgi:hypothetical protein